VEFDPGMFVAMVEKVVVNWKENKGAIVLHYVMKNGMIRKYALIDGDKLVASNTQFCQSFGPQYTFINTRSLIKPSSLIPNRIFLFIKFLWHHVWTISQGEDQAWFFVF